MSTVKQTTTSPKSAVTLGKQRNYAEVVDFLNKNWTTGCDGKNVERARKLDKAFNSPSQKIETVLVGGTNGKSLTVHFATKLLRTEGFTVGSFYAPHLLTYNERFSLDEETITNKLFTELANEVINTAESIGLKANTQELLTQIAFNYFTQNNVDVAVLEVEHGGASHSTVISSPKIVAITRLTSTDVNAEGQASQEVIKEYLGAVAKDAHLLSSDQNKANLKSMSEHAAQVGAEWAMPIRKLVALTYPFEQLHGRCAALAERIASVFVNSFAFNHPSLVKDSLLARVKGQRGRPTLEAKRESQINPKRTIEHFWKETTSTLSGRFQLLEKEKPTVLLDNANNIDAFSNFLLGIRLLHYNRSLKGLTLIIGCPQETLDYQEFLRAIRYFFKKTSGNIFICPVPERADQQTTSWDAEKVAQDMKALKIKARAVRSFKDAFDAAKKTVNDRHGLIAIAGSENFVAEYWNYKGIKKI
ncbi:MAG: dihydrofolate synthase/folylpolyglutamate synthase [Alteromonas naphthalenivorans]|jgi:dihydrofolate synthase/folylpolyglutamate synthase